jgi:hypothetical protein
MAELGSPTHGVAHGQFVYSLALYRKGLLTAEWEKWKGEEGTERGTRGWACEGQSGWHIHFWLWEYTYEALRAWN